MFKGAIAKLSRVHHVPRRRRGELARLMEFRQQYNVATADVQALALVLADALAFGFQPIDYFSFCDASGRIGGPSIDERTAMAVIHRVSALMEAKSRWYRLMHPVAAGRALELTCEERLFCKIRTMSAIDESPAERKERAAAQRRKRDAEWHRRARVAKGSKLSSRDAGSRQITTLRRNRVLRRWNGWTSARPPG